MTTLALARKKLIPTEFDEQKWLLQWAELAQGKYPELQMLYAIPNGGYLLSKAAAGKLKAAGLKKGVPDLSLDVARGSYHGLRIEMKRTVGGQVSFEQKVWQMRLQAQGYHVVVCKGWEAARDVLIRYLSLPTGGTGLDT